MSANPFITGNNVAWNANELILNDPQMRKMAGVSTLDTAMLEMTGMTNSQSQKTKGMKGGAAIYAPFYDPRAQWDGPEGNTPYASHGPVNQINDNLTSLKFSPIGQTGGFPQRYFTGDKPACARQSMNL